MTLLLLAIVLGPALVGVSGAVNFHSDWRTASRDSAGLATDPATSSEAVIQVYAARALNRRGVFVVPTWIATKAADAREYAVHQVVRWTVRHGSSVIESAVAPPDRRWYVAVR